MMTGKCTCDLRTKLAGDGCRYCNPDLLVGMHEDEIKELEAERDALLEQIKKNESLTDGSVRIPTNQDEAIQMVNLGVEWLRTNDPEGGWP